MRLRWDCLIEGRLPSMYIKVIRPMLKESGTRVSIERFGRDFIEKLLQITHKQWLFRNSRKHYRGFEGLTEAQHYRIFDEMDELRWVDPMTLLPCHQHLLELNLGYFGDCSSRQRQLWITKMRSAVSAAERVRSGKYVSHGLKNFMTPRKPPTSLHRSALGSKVYRSTSRSTSIGQVRPTSHSKRSEWMSHYETDWTVCFHTVPGLAAGALPYQADKKDSALPFFPSTRPVNKNININRMGNFIS